MAIKPVCDKCGDLLNEFGAIVLSPPDKRSRVTKFHLCKHCYKKVADWTNAKARPEKK